MIAALPAAGRAIRDQYRLGLSLFLIAPTAVALVVVPEFAQHVAEIRLGIFDSLAAARRLADDPTRWAFGYVKLAGLMLAFLACARAAWCARNGGRWWDLREVAWVRFLAGFALFAVVGFIAEPLAGRVPDAVLQGARALASLLSLPFLLVALGGLFGDRVTDWRLLLGRGWPYLLLAVLLLVTGYGPAQLLHGLNHKLAFGAHPALVWALMIWDSLVVGALAALVGAGLAITYEHLARRHAPALTRP